MTRADERLSVVATPSPTRSRAGRPTKAAAAKRDERLLEIAAVLFMEHGFEATSMDGVAEAASVGKATLYARYPDKASLFADVVRRRIITVYASLEDEVFRDLSSLSLRDSLRHVARAMLQKSLSPENIALSRILSAQGPRFPDLAELAVREGWGRQINLIERVLAPFAEDQFFTVDMATASDLFISLVVGRASRFALLGAAMSPAAVAARADIAVDFFVRGLVGEPASA